MIVKAVEFVAGLFLFTAWLASEAAGLAVRLFQRAGEQL